MSFITKSNNPYEYYIKALKTCIKSIIGDNKELCDKVFKNRMEAFENENKDIPSAQVAPNHPDRIVRFACYVSEYVFRDILTITLTNSHGTPVLTPAFGVEYYTYDIEGEFTSKEEPYFKNDFDGYYITCRTKLWNNIKFQPNAKNKLTKPNSYGAYDVIDFEELTRRLRRDIRNYYYQHPDYVANKTPDENLQQIFGKALGELSVSLVKPNTRNRTQHYGF